MGRETDRALWERQAKTLVHRPAKPRARVGCCGPDSVVQPGQDRQVCIFEARLARAAQRNPGMRLTRFRAKLQVAHQSRKKPGIVGDAAIAECIAVSCEPVQEPQKRDTGVAVPDADTFAVVGIAQTLERQPMSGYEIGQLGTTGKCRCKRLDGLRNPVQPPGRATIY